LVGAEIGTLQVAPASAQQIDGIVYHPPSAVDLPRGSLMILAPRVN
jgi:hypothetical protein